MFKKYWLIIVVLLCASVFPTVYANSSAEVTVQQNGDGDFVLTYFGDDYGLVKFMYDSAGQPPDEAFKAEIVTFGSTYGWNIDNQSILIDINEGSEIITISFTALGMAEQNGSDWNINFSSIKTAYPFVEKNESANPVYFFISTAKPTLLLPESLNVMLPEDVVQDQFNNESYILSYLFTAPTLYAITFDTEPANNGTINFDGTSYSDGENVSKQMGNYTISANPASGYMFSMWETNGSITVMNSNVSSTNCTVNGEGTLKLVQTEGTTTNTTTTTTTTSETDTETTTTTTTTTTDTETTTPTTPPVTPEPPPGCIIVTATLGSPMAPEVLYMRYVRDDLIASNHVGKIMVAGWNTFYYSWSPPIAESISKYEPLRSTVRILLTPLFGIIHSTAYTYKIIEPVNTMMASMISFLSAAIMSIAVYIAIPTLGLGVLARKLNFYIKK